MSSLDQLFAEAIAQSKLPKKKREKKATTFCSPSVDAMLAKSQRQFSGVDSRTFADIQRELREIKQDLLKPVLLNLPVTRETCACGKVHTSINSAPMLTMQGDHVMHDAVVVEMKPAYKELPRSITFTDVQVPYCTYCFLDFAEEVEG